MFFIFDEKTEPADIFAEIPSEKPEAASSAPRPAPSGAGPSGTTPLAVGASGVILERAPSGKKWLIILVIALVLVGGGVAAYFLLWKSGTPTAPILPATTTPEVPEPVPEPIPEPEPQPQPEVSATNTDSDGDGLPDAREAQLGTNPNLVDTDADGLSDREEVDVYGTDPLNPDTDGDTYMDGAEVEGGYDPKGPGRLLQIPSSP